MELDEATWQLETGYCLWIGAGVTRQIAAGHSAVPLWDQLTRELEAAAGIESDASNDFPSRLDKCMTAVGDVAFARFLRERYYTSLCEALLLQAAALTDSEEILPEIGPIFWFNSQFSDDTRSWASEHAITTVRSDWSDFWQRWRTLPIEVDEKESIAAWYLAVSEAT